MPKKKEEKKKRPWAVLYVPDDELKAQASVKKQIPALQKEYRLMFRNPALFKLEELEKRAEVAFIPDREKDQHVVKAYEKAEIKVVLLKVPKPKQPTAEEK